MMEGGERLVFEAKASRLAFWGHRLLAGVMVLSAVIILGGTTGLLGLAAVTGLLTVLPPWFNVRFDAWVATLAVVSVGAFAVRETRRLWRCARRAEIGPKLTLDDTGVHLLDTSDRTLDVPWEELVAVTVCEDAAGSEPRVLSLKLHSTQGSVYLFWRLPCKNELLQVLLARTGFIKTWTGRLFWDTYSGFEPAEGKQLRLNLARLRWLPPGGEPVFLLERRRKWAVALGLAGLVIGGGTLIGLASRPSPVTEVTPEMPLVKLPEAEARSLAWRPGSPEVALLLRPRQTDWHQPESPLRRIALVRPTGEINYLTDWTKGLGAKVWSPDGKWLACAHNRYPLTAAEQKRLDAHLPADAEAVARLRAKQQAKEVWLLEVDTGKRRVLVQAGEEGALYQLAWSPSGKWLAAGWQWAEPDGPQYGVWIAPVDGQTAQRRFPLPKGSRGPGKLSWAPDESAVLAVASRTWAPRWPFSGGSQSGLLFDLSTGQSRELFTIKGLPALGPLSPKWEADSRGLLLPGFRWGEACLDRLDVESGKNRRIAHWADRRPWVMFAPLDWSPSGNSVLFGALTIVVKAPPGCLAYDLARRQGDIMRLMVPAENGILPAWSSDGKWLAVAVKRGIRFIQVPEGVW